MKRTPIFVLLAALGLSSQPLCAEATSRDGHLQDVVVKATSAEDYPLNFDIDQAYTHGSRRLNGVVLEGSADGQQSFNCPTPLKVYSSLLHKSFTARPGETLTPKFNYSGDWMHGFVYLDFGQDGTFDATLNRGELLCS